MSAPLLLVTEDSDDLREVLVDFLASRGYRVIARADAATAAEAVRSTRPDLVVTDIFLGTTSGLDLIVEIRKSLPDPPPIIATSGMPEVEAQARACGATLFLPKPVDPSLLAQSIDELLSRRTPSPTLIAAHAQRSRDLRAERQAAVARALIQLEPMVALRMARFQHDTAWLQAFLGFGTVVLAFQDDQRLPITASGDLQAWPLGEDLELALPMTRHVLETGSTFVVPDLRSLSSVEKAPPVRFFAGFPFFFHETPIGVLCVLDAAPRALDRADFALIEALCGRTSSMMSGELSSSRPNGFMKRAGLEIVLRSELERASRSGEMVHLLVFAADEPPPDILSERTAIGQLTVDRYALSVTRSTEDGTPRDLVESVARIASQPGFGGGELLSVEPAAVPLLDSDFTLRLAERRLDARVADGTLKGIRRVVIHQAGLDHLTAPAR